jgi:glycosyltransferase involved in cell wall biosynthesis
VRLIVAGPVKKGCEAYWRDIERRIALKNLEHRVRMDVTLIPEADVEVYFKAAHVTVLPYKKISQSGVLFLSFGFGVTVIASDADGLPEAIDEGVNGCIFRKGDAEDLARRIVDYFGSEMFSRLDAGRSEIIARLTREHSWDR